MIDQLTARASVMYLQLYRLHHHSKTPAAHRQLVTISSIRPLSLARGRIEAYIPPFFMWRPTGDHLYLVRTT